MMETKGDTMNDSEKIARIKDELERRVPSRRWPPQSFNEYESGYDNGVESVIDAINEILNSDESEPK
mgnify:CR=1 FL=1